MEDRWGLGPVFAYEWLTGSRRPQVYATRAGFVAALLVVLIAVWWVAIAGKSAPTVRDFAAAGAAFYLGLVGTQLALVMLAAPAATAGAICLEKSRGTLTHLLVTDLSDPEIVLGKLAARLVPTLMLVLCGLPVLFLASLLGGIDPMALLGSTLVTMGVAALACSMALTISVWGRKTQDVLVATYVAMILWLLAYPTSMAFGWGKFTWLWKLDPFQLALAPYSSPGAVGLGSFFAFFCGTVAVSAALVGVAVVRFRRVAATSDRPARVRRWGQVRFASRFGPSLDTNPVLWRERHRARPSGWGRSFWRLYFVLSFAFAAVAMARSSGSTGADIFAEFVAGLSVAVGLLMLSVDAATALAEERARGSLDVLMTTPLSTRSIVWAKWRGVYRRVFGLAILPTIVTGFCMKTNKLPGVLMTGGLILVYGATVTSLGLALATWVPRLGRAVAMNVGIYAIVTVGGFFLVYAGVTPPGLEAEFAVGSPFYGPIFSMDEFDHSSAPGRSVFWVAGWFVLYATTAAALLLATLATFDRCLGRADDRPGRAASWSARGLHSLRLRPSPGPHPRVESHARQE